jgi:hypothetical protein
LRNEYFSQIILVLVNLKEKLLKRKGVKKNYMIIYKTHYVLFCCFCVLQRGKAFCVVFGSNHDVLYLLAPNYDIRDKWVKGMRYALQLNQFLKQKETDKL